MLIGKYIGRLSYPFLRRRKRIVLINLKIAFPNKTNKQLDMLAKKCFESVLMAAFEIIIAWFMSEKRFKKIKFDCHGIQHFECSHNNKHHGTILLGTHFTCMEIIGRYMGENYPPFYLVYQQHKNSFFEKVMMTSREKYIEKTLPRKNMMSVIRHLNRSCSVWYAPDQDLESKRSIFVPFFGKKCATLTVTSLLSKLTQATVIPCYYTRKADLTGYDIKILPPLEGYPTGDEYQDALQYNKMLEEMIINFPDQYLWQHRRYKTRPKDEKPVY